MITLQRITPWLVASAITLAAPSTWAATYTVSSDADTNTPGTLRYAINKLAGSSDPQNTLKFAAPGYVIKVSRSLPSIQRPVTFLGNDTTIVPVSGFVGDEVLEIDLGGSGKSVEIYGVAFTGGGNRGFRALTARDDMELRLENCLVERYGDLGVKGGALLSTVSGVELVGSRFVGNQGSTGGAIRVAEASSLFIEDCGFSDNRSSGYGAGVYVEGPDVTLEVLKSYFHDNETTDDLGGAILIHDGFGSSSMVHVSDSTFYENGAGVAGADVGMTGTGGSPTLTIVNSTLVDAGTGWSGLSLAFLDKGGHVEVYDSVIAPRYPAGQPGFGCLFNTSSITAEGNIGTADTWGGSWHSCGLDQSNNQVIARPMIRLSCTEASPPAWANPPFQVYGGADTMTCTPLCESPVIDAALSSSATSDDQRRFGIEGSGRDIGAHELSSGDNPGVPDPAVCAQQSSCGNGMIDPGEQCETGLDCPQPHPFEPMFCQDCQCAFPINR